MRCWPSGEAIRRSSNAAEAAVDALTDVGSVQTFTWSIDVAVAAPRRLTNKQTTFEDARQRRHGPHPARVCCHAHCQLGRRAFRRCSETEPEAIVLVLDPGMAFGTGSHPTTRLCLEWLERSVTPNVSLLDYGCGSAFYDVRQTRRRTCFVL